MDQVAPNLCIRVVGASGLPPLGTFNFRCELVDPEKLRRPFQKASWIVRRYIGNTAFVEGPSPNWDHSLEVPYIPKSLLRGEIVSKPGLKIYGEATLNVDELALTAAERPFSMQIDSCTVVLLMSIRDGRPPDPPKKGGMFSSGLMKLDGLVNRGVTKATNFLEPKLAQASEALKSAIVSKGTEESWDAITGLVYQEFRDVECSKLDFLMGLALLNTYYQSNKQRTNAVVLDEAFLKECHYYAKFAVGAYGWKLREFEAMQRDRSLKTSAKGLGQGFSEGDAENLASLCKLTGLTPADVIDTQWSSAEVFDPGHYVALDHSTDSIVVGLRGTFHLRDVLIDLCGANESFMDGMAHSGILRTAMNKSLKLQPIIADALANHPSYKIRVTGHSLGAGTAALLTIIWSRDYPKWPLKCYAFAPPCVTSEALSDQFKDRIISFVHNDDVIPRLCHGSIQALKNVILELLAQTENNVQRMYHLLNSGNSLGEGASRRIAGFLQVQHNPEYHKIRAEADVEVLVPPGTVYWSYKRERSDKYCVLEKSENAFFQEVVISPDMMFDHMPFVYENTLRSIIDNLPEIAGAEAARGPQSPSLRDSAVDVEAAKIMEEKRDEVHAS